MTTLNLILSILFGITIGGGLFWILLREKHAREELALVESVARLESTLQAERNQATRELDLLKDARKELTEQFENLANKTLERTGKKFAEQNQTNIKILLDPLQERIKSFESRVNQTAKDGDVSSAKLREKIDGLTSLNQLLHKDAKDLTQALKGEAKTRGNWGELQLERVLELSGLEKDVSYSTQVTGTSADGKRRLPDAVIHLPEDRSIVVDAKVSLNAYADACSATEDQEREGFLKKHTTAVKTHIKQLSAKDYADLDVVNSLDFVLMFIPIEPAFASALQHDPDLLGFALKHNILMVTPTTLLAALRTIENMWRIEKQNLNAQEIADQAGKLYDKFVGFTDDMQTLDKNISKTRKTYDAAFNKLTSGTGNLVRRAEQLKILGAKTSKALDESLLEKSLEENELILSATGK